MDQNPKETTFRDFQIWVSIALMDPNDIPKMRYTDILTPSSNTNELLQSIQIR